LSRRAAARAPRAREGRHDTRRGVTVRASPAERVRSALARARLSDVPRLDPCSAHPSAANRLRDRPVASQPLWYPLVSSVVVLV
jgi:hypothetical protein